MGATSPAATSSFSCEVSDPQLTWHDRALAILQSQRTGLQGKQTARQLQSSTYHSSCQHPTLPGSGEGSIILLLCHGAEQRASPTAACFNHPPVDVGACPELDTQQCLSAARAGSGQQHREGGTHEGMSKGGKGERAQPPLRDPPGTGTDPGPACQLA